MSQSVEQALVVRMEATLAKFEKQMARAKSVANSSANDIEKRFARQNRTIAQTSETAGRGLARMTQIGGAGRFVLQNTANQIGDIAVQLQGGAGAARAFGQQLPQLLGGFGALGGSLGLIAPLLGTVAALGVPVAAALLMTGKEAESLDDRMKALKSSIDAVRAASDQSGTSMMQLRDEYGDLADEARQVFEINRQIASLRAGAALDSAARGVAESLGLDGAFDLLPAQVREIEQAIQLLRDERDSINAASANFSDAGLRAANDRVAAIADEIDLLKTLGRNLDDLADMLGITEAEAKEVVARFAEIGQAEGARAQAQAMSDLSAFIKDVSGNLVNAEEEGRTFYERLVEATTQALELAKVDVAGNISEAAGYAATLAENLALARGANLDKLAGGNVDFFDPRNETGTAGVIPQNRPVPEKNRTGYKPPKPRRGAGSSANQDLSEAQRMFQATRSEAERYASELDRINELHRMFPEIITTEVRDRAISALNDSVGELGSMANRIESSLADLFTQVISGSMSAKDAVQQLLQTLTKMLLNRAFQQIFKNVPIFGGFGGGPVVPSANGNVISGGTLVPFAAGGIVSAPTFFPMSGGRTGVAGEAGPEAIMPVARINGKLGVRAAGGGTTVVVQNFTNQPVRQQKQKGPDGRELIKVTVGEGMARGEFDAPLKARSGMTPKTVKR